jgi:hypothetical protein
MKTTTKKDAFTALGSGMTPAQKLQLADFFLAHESSLTAIDRDANLPVGMAQHGEWDAHSVGTPCGCCAKTEVRVGAGGRARWYDLADGATVCVFCALDLRDLVSFGVREVRTLRGYAREVVRVARKYHQM